MLHKNQKIDKHFSLPEKVECPLFRLRQSRVWDLMTGKGEKFSLEMPITLATRAGLHVSLKTAA